MKGSAVTTLQIARTLWLGCVVCLLVGLSAGATGCSVEPSCVSDKETITTVVSSSSSTTSEATTTSEASIPASSSTVGLSTSTTEAGEVSSSTTLSASSTTTIASTTTTEALSSAEVRLADGTIKAMGFIDRVWVSGGTRYLSIDYAEMLTGEEARQAAIEAGEIGPAEVLPNDYFIRNVNPKKRQFRVSLSVAITTSTRWPPHDGMGVPCTWEDFLSFWGPGPLPEGDRHMCTVPWWIVRDGDLVIRIDEQYLP